MGGFYDAKTTYESWELVNKDCGRLQLWEHCQKVEFKKSEFYISLCISSQFSVNGGG